MYSIEGPFHSERTISGHVIVFENVLWNCFNIRKHLLESVLVLENSTLHKKVQKIVSKM